MALLLALARGLGWALGLCAVKAAVLLAVDRVVGLSGDARPLLAIALSQGREFAFVLFGVAGAAGLLPPVTRRVIRACPAPPRRRILLRMSRAIRGASLQAAALLTVVAALLGVTVGAAAGVGGYVFVYADGASYLTDDPNACANCHVMRDHLDAWAKSSHHAVAVCNDCHAPRGLAGKVAVKAINGWNHSIAFLTGDFKEPFHITQMNRQVTGDACRTCHGDIVEAIDHPWMRRGAGGPADAAPPVAAEPIACVRCHANVGHDVQ